MRWIALATDYDGTLAHHGVVADAAVAGLTRFAASGRKVLLVTGRQLDDLAECFPRLDVFDAVVAENGAVLHRPATGETRVVAQALPPRFAEELRERGVDPVSLGQVIVATWRPHAQKMLEVIRDLGLELQVIFNRGRSWPCLRGSTRGRSCSSRYASSASRSTMWSASATPRTTMRSFASARWALLWTARCLR
jgi:HAD superfamily hydrolase (TIGR01484 family)